MTDKDDPNAAIHKYNKDHESADGSTDTGLLIPGLEEFLGKGYDIFGLYASSRSCKGTVIDFSDAPLDDQQVIDASLELETIEKAFNQVPTEIHLVYKRPKTVSYLPLFEIESVNEFDKTINDQMTKWSADLKLSGSYGAFAGEVDARFSSDLSKLATTTYYSLVSKASYWQLSLDYSPEDPAPLADGVQAALDDPASDPEELFAKYGTHYLNSVILGCKVTISCATDTSQVESDFDFSTYLNLTYGGEGESAGLSADAAYQQKVKNFHEHSKTTVFGVGISTDQIEKIKAGADSGVSVLKGGWHNPTLVDFPSDALIPIWNHCTDPDRKQQFQAAFEKLAASHASAISSLSLYKPLYLYRGEVNDAGPDIPGPGFQARCAGLTYRLYPTTNLAGSTDADGIAWEIQNNSKPFINIAKDPIPGTRPLFAWRLLPDRHVWRFAMGAPYEDIFHRNLFIPIPPFSEYPEEMMRCWELVSSTAIGYVVDPYDERFQRPAGVRPVYLYNSPTVQWVSYYSLDALDNTRAPREIWKRSTPEFEERYRIPPGIAPHEISQYPGGPDRAETDRLLGPRWLGWSFDEEAQ